MQKKNSTKKKPVVSPKKKTAYLEARVLKLQRMMRAGSPKLRNALSTVLLELSNVSGINVDSPALVGEFYLEALKELGATDFDPQIDSVLKDVDRLINDETAADQVLADYGYDAKLFHDHGAAGQPTPGPSTAPRGSEASKLAIYRVSNGRPKENIFAGTEFTVDTSGRIEHGKFHIIQEGETITYDRIYVLDPVNVQVGDEPENVERAEDLRIIGPVVFIVQTPEPDDATPIVRSQSSFPNAMPFAPQNSSEDEWPEVIDMEGGAL